MKKLGAKLKAGLMGLIDAKASESYSMWTALVLKGVGLFAPGVYVFLDGLAGFISGGEMTGQSMLGGLIGYAVLRMTSKGAKAEA